MHYIAMITKARKRNADGPKKQDASLRQDAQEAIDRVWPDGIVQMSFDPDESYLCRVHPKLARAFHCIQNARLIHEREA